MAKRPDFLPLETPRGWCVNVPSSMTASGARRRKYFPTLAKAEKFAASVRASHGAGVRGSMISASLALQASEAERILEGSGVTLVEAARMALAKLGVLSRGRRSATATFAPCSPMRRFGATPTQTKWPRYLDGCRRRSWTVHAGGSTGRRLRQRAERCSRR